MSADQKLPRILLLSYLTDPGRIAGWCRDHKIDILVPVDVRTQALVKHAGPRVTGAGDYFAGMRERLQELEERAFQLALTWFRDLPRGDSGYCIEEIYSREFFSLFLNLFRGYELIRQIRDREGPCVIYTPEPAGESGRTGSIRLGKEESPLPDLLAHLGAGLGIEHRLIRREKKAGCARKGPGGMFWGALAQAAASLRGPSDILWLGNPSLLAPVGSELKTAHGLRCRRLRLARSFRDFIACFQTGTYACSDRRTGEEASFPEEPGFRSVLEDNRVFVFEGISFFEAVWNRLSLFYRREYRGMESLVRNLEIQISRSSASMLIVDEDVTPANKAAVLAARKRGLHTRVIAHGLPGLRHGFFPLTADCIEGWGDYHADRLQAWGIASDRIRVSGCPKYDGLKPEIADSGGLKKKLCRENGWEDQKPLILVMPNGIKTNALERFVSHERISEEDILIASEMLRMARSFPGVHFLYKFHLGSWDPEVFRGMEKAAGGPFPNFKWVHDGAAVNLIRAADLVLSGWTSAAMETLRLGRPLRIIHWEDYPEVHPYGAHGISMLRSPDELADLCRDLETGAWDAAAFRRKQEEAVHYFLHAADRGASRRICDHIREALRQSMP